MSAKSAILQGQKLSLRPLTEADISSDYVSWLNDPEVNRYLEVGREPVSAEQIRTRLNTYGEGTANLIFAIIDTESGKHVGNVTLNNISTTHGHGDTGLIIGDRSFWGKGYARQAWSLLVDFAFKQLELRKVEAGVVVGNIGSEKALRAIGFKEEGRQRQHFFADGKHCDVIRFGVFPEEFQPCH
jgi:ribosomal-protein-alanine N-acetyltransferase